MSATVQAELARMLTQEQHHVHLIGVAGSGMSGIAALLLELGHTVSGSDKVQTLEIERLEQLGLRFHRAHRAEDAAGAELIVFSSAIRDDNPILAAARGSGQTAIRRAEALAAIMRGKRGVIVAGMHGKTTTSAMLAHVLRGGGLHPSHYVGAEIPILGSNAHWDRRGEYFVAEGDESDGTLRLFRPEHALILNIEEEHLDFYADLSAIEAVFRQLLEQTEGKTFYCADDAHAARLCRERSGAAVSFGFGEPADYRGVDIELRDFASVFCVHQRGRKLGEATLSVPGRHNVSNALGVIAVATELGVPFEKIAASLAQFRHARRRFEIKYQSERFMLVDDYAHHPTEIRATLATARTAGRSRVLAMFQPHRYSRTKALRKEFGQCFGDADRLVVTDVYPASERPIEGITGQTIVDEVAAGGHAGVVYQPRLDRLHWEMGNMLASGDLVLSLGAGNIHEQLAILAGDLVVAERLKEIVGEEGEVRLYEPLARHTTLRVGGPAQFWVEPRDESAFAGVIRFCRAEKLPLFVIGRGSNLLVRDGGIRGVVVHPSGGEFDRVEVSQGTITAGVGAKLKQVAYAGKSAGIGGLEWMEGIPGEVGGGLRMNAGAMGAQTFDNVESVRFLDAEGNPHTKKAAEMEVHYRHVPSLENKLRRLGRFHRSARAGGGDFAPARGIAGETAHFATGRPQRRLHFQKSEGMPGRPPGGRAGIEEPARRQRPRLRGARQFHGQRWRRDRGGDAGPDRPGAVGGAGETGNRTGDGSANRGGTGMSSERKLPSRVAVLMGGPSAEREVSLATGRGVAKALRALELDVTEVDVKGPDFELPAGTELAFIALHGTFGEDGEVQRLLEERGVAYTGEGIEGSRIAFDKILSKERFDAGDVPTPAWEVIGPGERPAMTLPFVVKAPRQGSTVGVYIVKTPEEVDAALAGASEYDQRILVEKFMPGRELTVGVLGDLALPILEIIPKGGFYDFNNKYPFLNPTGGGGAQHVCPAEVPERLGEEIRALAVRAHRALGLQVYSRVDFILPEDGRPTVLELNTIPGMTESSLLPEAAGVAGIGYPELCARIIRLSLEARSAK